MEKVKLSPSGPALSPVVTGVWRWHSIDEQQQDALIRKSLELGLTTFDHADIYGNYSIEALFGKSIKADPSLREKMEIVTKCGICLKTDKKPQTYIKHYDTSRAHILNSVNQSLKNLHTEYIDLLLIHRPDPLMRAEELAETFSLLKREGKVLHFGVSNFSCTQFELLNQYVPLATNQIEISALNLGSFQNGMLDLLQKHKIKAMAWSPLGGGVLFKEALNELVFRVQAVLKELSEKYTAAWDEILLAWLMQHPTGILPILGTTKLARLDTAVKALKLSLDRQDWFRIYTASLGTEVA